MTDFQYYQTLQAHMRPLVRSGEIASPAFNEAWETCEAIKNRHGGFPPMPDEVDDEQAREMEACEEANEKGLR